MSGLIRQVSDSEAFAFAGLRRLDTNVIVGRALENMGFRADTGETAIFGRQLEQILSEVYMTEYADIKFRRLLPVSGEISNAVPIYTYRQFDEFGQVTPIVDSAAADNVPLVDVQGVEITNSCKSFAVGFQYTIQELRAAAYVGGVAGGVGIDNMRAQTARRVMERHFDTLAAVGGFGFNGIANASNIIAVTKGTQKTGTTWQDASGNLLARPEEILADVHGMCRSVFDTTNGAHEVNTLVLDTKGYSLMASKPQSPAFTDQSLMSYILRMSPWIKNIEFWPQLNTAGAGSKARILAYKKDPSVLKCQIPQEFEMFPAQARGMGFSVTCHARWGGVCVYKPKAIAYMDGTEP